MVKTCQTAVQRRKPSIASRAAETLSGKGKISAER
jgi:hypothetical protein